MGNPEIYKYGIKTRFPVNRQDHTQKHPGGYLMPLFKKAMNNKLYLNRKMRKAYGLKPKQEIKPGDMFVMSFVFNLNQNREKRKTQTALR